MRWWPEEKFNGKVFETVIRTNIQLAKAQEAGKDIFRYDRSSNGAKDYRHLAEELIRRSYSEPIGRLALSGARS